jgi:hypothetical protein
MSWMRFRAWSGKIDVEIARMEQELGGAGDE